MYSPVLDLMDHNLIYYMFDEAKAETAAEKSRADKAESKANSYRQKLIALGVDPDAP